MSNKDFSIRIPATPKRIQLLEKKSSEKRVLSRIRDVMFKPIGRKLTSYHPNKACIRLREFLEEELPSTLVEIKTVKAKIGYGDKKRKFGKGKTSGLMAKAEKLGYEQWGEMFTVSTEYKLDFDNNLRATVLFQEITPVGKYLKIESLTQKGLEKALALLSATGEEKIERNAAVLLAEKLGFVS